MIETVNDVNNTFLSRREITCNFKGIGGKLKKLEAVNMISKQFKLEGKVIIPIFMKTHSGKPEITGTFYVYENEELARKQVNPVIFKRLEKAKGAAESAKTEVTEAPVEGVKKEESKA
jgi:ribosomal protein S24E